MAPIVLALLMTLAACRSPSQKANNAEMLYDQAVAAGDYRTAIRQIRLAIAQNDAEARYWIKLGRASLAASAYPDAYSAYSQALALQPDNIEALQTVAQIALLSGNLQTARQYVETLQVLAPQDPRGRLIAGNIALRQNHLDEAAGIADGLIKDGVDADEVYILKAQVLDRQRRFADAAAALEPRVAASQNKPALLDQLLTIYRHEGNREGTESTYRRFIAVAPDDPVHALQYARLLWADGRTDQARKLAADVLGRNPASGDVKLKVASFWADAAPTAVAMPEMLRIAGTGSLTLKAAIAQRLVDMGQAQTAFTLLDPLVGKEDVDAGNVPAQVAYAYALRGIGRLPAARARVDAVLDFDKTNASGLRLRGELALAGGDLDQALTDTQLLVSVAPDFEPGAILLGRVYAARGDRVLADQSFARATANFPDSIGVLQANIDYLTGQKRMGQALSLAARFATTHPDTRAARAILIATCRKAGSACILATKEKGA